MSFIPKARDLQPQNPKVTTAARPPSKQLNESCALKGLAENKTTMKQFKNSKTKPLPAAGRKEKTMASAQRNFCHPKS